MKILYCISISRIQTIEDSSSGKFFQVNVIYARRNEERRKKLCCANRKNGRWGNKYASVWLFSFSPRGWKWFLTMDLLLFTTRVCLYGHMCHELDSLVVIRNSGCSSATWKKSHCRLRAAILQVHRLRYSHRTFPFPFQFHSEYRCTRYKFYLAVVYNIRSGRQLSIMYYVTLTHS